MGIFFERKKKTNERPPFEWWCPECHTWVKNESYCPKCGNFLDISKNRLPFSNAIWLQLKNIMV